MDARSIYNKAKNYRAEFKRRAVELTRQSGISSEFGIAPNVLPSRRSEADTGASKAFCRSP